MTAAIQASYIDESNARNISNRLKEREYLTAMIEAEGADPTDEATRSVNLGDGTPSDETKLSPGLENGSLSGEARPAQEIIATTDQQNEQKPKQSRIGRIFRVLMCGGRTGAGKKM